MDSRSDMTGSLFGSPAKSVGAKTDRFSIYSLGDLIAKRPVVKGRGEILNSGSGSALTSSNDPIARRGDNSALVESWSAFWADAGVDLAFDDDPRDWIAEGAPPPQDAPKPDAPRPRPAQAAPAAAPAIGGPKDGWPTTLAAFRDWWMAEPLIDPGPVAGRVAPVGKAGARLMVLVADPAGDDGDALLSGEDGQLLDAMLRAMGLTRGDCYLASALPRHTPAADWRALYAGGLGALLRHHVALAAPQMLAIFGAEPVKLLAAERFDAASAQGAITLEIGGEAREIPLLASYPLAVMRGRPQAKALWWQRWLSLSRPY